MITHTKSIIIIATASFLLLDGGGDPSFVGSTLTGLNAPIAKKQHYYIATCIDQPVTKHIGYNDIFIFDAQDVSLSSSSPLVSSVLNKVDDADNGTCDIANNGGLALSMKYYPMSGYVGQDKCTYEMCIVDDDGESGGAINAATKECSELTIAIDVEDCSAVAANGEDKVIEEEYDVPGYEKVRYDVL